MRKAICAGGITWGPEWSLSGGRKLDRLFHQLVAMHAPNLQDGDLLFGFHFETWGSLADGPVHTGLGRRSYLPKHSMGSITLKFGREIVEGSDEFKRSEFARLIRAGADHLHPFLVKKTGKQYVGFLQAIDKIANGILADSGPLDPVTLSAEDVERGVDFVKKTAQRGRLTEEAAAYFEVSLRKEHG